jgi:hypothetical protein
MGFLPLHLAAFHGNMGVLQMLLEGAERENTPVLGTSVNCQDHQVIFRNCQDHLFFAKTIFRKCQDHF